MRIRRLAAGVGVAFAGSAVFLAGPSGAGASVASQAVAHRNIPVCPSPPSGYAHCHAVLHQAVTANGKPAPSATTPSGGLDPATYLQAYGWSGSSGRLIGTGQGQTVAVVDAYDDPTISSDLATFDSNFGLACSSCFTKVNQTGGTSYPTANSGWALEISLDVEWAHAIAPAAHILLVEASSNSFTNLMAAEDYASSHAAYVSNSWGGSEFSGESSYDGHFTHTGVSYFASAGDTGGVVEYPSSSGTVVSVGGTTLSQSSGTWTETGWSSSGGGCSAYETADSSQITGPSVNCSGTRATPDVASDADPNSGVDVYDSTNYNGQTGWFVVGGTSAASPVWAARAADRGVGVGAGYIYTGYASAGSYGATNIAYRDVTSGSNGYSAGVGYDLVTGLGSWTGGDSTTTVTAPGAPSALTATAGTSSIGLSWTAPTTGGTPTGYDVFRSTTSGAEYPGTPYATGVTATSWADTAATAGTTFYYEVTAVNNAGQSGPSNQAQASVTATTPAAAITGTNCSGASCTFSGTGATPLSWNFGDGHTGTGSPVTHSYTAAGSYTVTLTDGNAATASETVSCVAHGNPHRPSLSCS